MRMKLMIVILLLCFVSMGYAAEGIQGDRSYLQIFTSNEQCMILAFEMQLNSKVLLKYVVNQGKTSALKVRDIASIFYNLKDKSLEGMFIHIRDVLTEDSVNLDSILKFDKFKERVRFDYMFISEIAYKKLLMTIKNYDEIKE